MRISRVLSGAAFGAVLGMGAAMVAPAPAAAMMDVQCAETENYTCCCQMATDLVQSCSCTAKPRPIYT